VASAAWQLFRPHHYLNHELNPSAVCFLALWRGRPVAFSAWLHHLTQRSIRPTKREHRTVCLPDFQGVGIGNALSAFCASLYVAQGYRAVSTTSHPGMIEVRRRSPLWRMIRAPSLAGSKSSLSRAGIRHSGTRATAGFEYVGPPADRAELRLLAPISSMQSRKFTSPVR
jgi:GNAT superfamily N-acetyltransferase